MGRAKGMSGLKVAAASELRSGGETAYPKRKVTVKIENFYVCEYEFDKVVKVPGPTSTDDDYLEEWWNEEVYDYTGGHRCVDCDSEGMYTCTITEDSEPAFVGMKMEWGI
jgi:hypothetical protein